MAYTSTSKFLNILPYVLLEYQYTILPTPEEYPVNFGSTTVGFEKIYNGYYGINQILNGLVDVGVTGNSRSRSCVQIGDSTFVDLSANYFVQYLDFDNKLTPTSNLSITFPSNIVVKYDTIKFHFLSGYNFPSTNGVIFNVKFPENSGKKATIAQLIVDKSNTDRIHLNPRPIYFNGGVYDKYAEIKIPSFSDMCYQFDTLYGNPSQADTLGALISSDGNGFTRGNPFNINSYEIVSTSLINGYTTYITNFVNSAVVNSFDEYSYLSANLVENTDKNYWEYYPTWQSEFIDQFIYTENSLGNIYHVVNEIIVSEQIGYSFVETSRFQTIQTSGFDAPMIFRPIVMNSRATSFSIDYNVSLVNKVNNTSILRRASVTSMNVDLYGAGLNKIQLRNDPYPLKVYNKVVESSKLSTAYQINVNPINQVVNKYIPSFFEMESITIAETDSVLATIGSTNQSSANDSTIAYGQGNLKIVVNPFDNYYKFRIFNSIAGSENTVLDLGTSSTYYLVFSDGSGKQTKVASLTDMQFQNPSRGEIAFRMVEGDSKSVQNYSSRDFYITSLSPNGIETSLYYGTWILPSERSLKYGTSGSAGLSGASTAGSNGSAGTSAISTDSQGIMINASQLSQNQNIRTSNIQSTFDTSRDSVIRNIAPMNLSTTNSINSSESLVVAKTASPSIDIIALTNSIAGDEALGKNYKDITDYYTIPGRPGTNTYRGITTPIFLSAIVRIHPIGSEEYSNYSNYLGVTSVGL